MRNYSLTYWKMAFNLIVVSCLLAVAQAHIKPYTSVYIPYLESRITGGKEATKGEFPHQVSLQWGIPPLADLSHFCGGTILNSQWILTAGHCVLAVPSYGSFVVKAGKHLIKVTEQTEQEAEVERSFVHEKYPGSVAPYDIALLRLKTPLKLNANVAAIKLPADNSQPKGTLTLSGWGSISTSSKPSYPSALQKVNLTLVDLVTCKKSIESLTGSSPVHETNLCTGPITAGISACSGDSGGPLIVKGINGTAEVVGIVSWGIVPCGTRGAPSVYTRVSAHIDWINSIIKKTF